MNIQSSNSNKSVLRYFQRFGLLGFAFFFIKGILWILIPLLAHNLMS